MVPGIPKSSWKVSSNRSTGWMTRNTEDGSVGLVYPLPAR